MSSIKQKDDQSIDDTDATPPARQRGANLSGADLSGADLSGADLSGARPAAAPAAESAEPVTLRTAADEPAQIAEPGDTVEPTGSHGAVGAGDGVERADALEPAGAVEPQDAVEPADAVEPQDAVVAGGPVADDETVDRPATVRRGGLRSIVASLVIAAILAGVGTAFEIRAHHLRSTSAASNSALSDSGATSEVIGQVSTALNKVLSYNYTNAAATQQAAGAFLTGDAAGQYKTLFTALQQKAPGEKLTLAAKVVVGGVTSLTGNTAQLLVFLDQSSTRASDKQTSTSAAQLQVTAVKQAGTWKISELLPL